MLTLSSSLFLIAFPVGLIYAAVSDFRRFIIPNWTSVLLIFGFILAFLATPFGLERFAQHLAMFFVALAIGFGLFSLGLWGGGDGKLIAATAIWFTWPDMLSFLLYMSLAGGALSVLMLLAAKLEPALRKLPGLKGITLGERAINAPYGVAIAIGALLAFPDSAMFEALVYGIV
ncbi:MAG: prepilin peptidase [Neomegalonema sp.]|nr:prepilin peptidase [Neomegalonema sp.]